MAIPILKTDRLILRPWVEDDHESFARYNADPRVMEFLPNTLTRAESDELIRKIEHHFEEHGFGLWAVEIPGVTTFAGTAGLLVPSFEAHFTPCIEIGWRFGVEFWGKGYASEAARAVLDFGFDQQGLSEIVSFTATTNWRSRRLMERLGMRHSGFENFLHPSLAPEHPLGPHVLYRLTHQDFIDAQKNQHPDPSRQSGGLRGTKADEGSHPDYTSRHR